MPTVAEFKIEYKQILDPRGDIVAPLPKFAADLGEVLRMYQAMTRVRVFDAKAVNLQRTGQLGTYPSSLGHEATHVAVGAAMRPEDVLAPVYREFGTQLWRGVTMAEILLYWGGDERGNDFARPKHDFAWCVPIATQTLHAAGAAMAFKLRKEPRCALAYIGDGGTSEGAFYEALNLAGARCLPIVFVIVNNGWAISVPVAAQTATQTLAQKAVAAGIPGMQVDGNDVFAVREVVGEALETARRGGGPCLIEALTYRLSDHTTADDASRYRGTPRSQGGVEARAPDSHTRVPVQGRRLDRRAGAGSAEGLHAPSRCRGERISEHRQAVDRRHVRLPVRGIAAASARAACHCAQIRRQTQRSLNWQK